MKYINSRNPSNSLRAQRGDLSPYLFHFTKGANPLGNMESILRELRLRSKSRDYICFTDAPITSNRVLLEYMEEKYPSSPLYSKFGIGFSRDVMFEEYNARNVIYDKEEAIPPKCHKDYWRYEEMNIENHDYSWLREWRVKGNSFDFSTFPKEHIIIIAPTRKELLELAGNEKIDFDFGYEPEIGECIPSVIQSNKRIWKGFPIDEIKKIPDDFALSGSTRNQTIGEDIGFE